MEVVAANLALQRRRAVAVGIGASCGRVSRDCGIGSLETSERLVVFEEPGRMIT